MGTASLGKILFGSWYWVLLSIWKDWKMQLQLLARLFFYATLYYIVCSRRSWTKYILQNEISLELEKNQKITSTGKIQSLGALRVYRKPVESFDFIQCRMDAGPRALWGPFLRDSWGFFLPRPSELLLSFIHTSADISIMTLAKRWLSLLHVSPKLWIVTWVECRYSYTTSYYECEDSQTQPRGANTSFEISLWRTYMYITNIHTHGRW